MSKGMGMWLLLGFVLAIYPVSIFIEYLFETHRRRTGYRTLVKLWSSTPENKRERFVAQWLEKNPRCGAGWFLRGLLDLRSERVRHAARAFGMAHHCDVNLESAALLTFTCLKTTDCDPENLLNLANSTWLEMKRPAIGTSWEEKLIFDALGTPGKMEQSPIVRLHRLIAFDPALV
jgi:hypothetical protein